MTKQTDCAVFGRFAVPSRNSGFGTRGETGEIWVLNFLLIKRGQRYGSTELVWQPRTCVLTLGTRSLLELDYPSLSILAVAGVDVDDGP